MKTRYKHKCVLSEGRGPRFCNKSAKGTRTWANVEVRLCDLHLEEWDRLMTWALVDFYIERLGDGKI